METLEKMPFEAQHKIFKRLAEIAAAASFIACVTFVCCLAGHLLGKKFGSWLGGKAEIFGGVILVCIGAKILVEHLSGG